MNLNRTIKDLFGKEAKQSFPASEEDRSKPETVRNILLNALSVFPIRDRKQVFWVTSIAQKIIEGGENFELEYVYKSVLVEAVYESMIRKNDKGKLEGMYLPYAVAQVLEELGEKELKA